MKGYHLPVLKDQKTTHTAHRATDRGVPKGKMIGQAGKKESGSQSHLHIERLSLDKNSVQSWEGVDA